MSRFSKVIPWSFIYSTLLRATVILSGFAIFILTSYMYGPTGRGIISFLGSFYFAGSLILSFGIGRTSYQLISKSPQQSSIFLYFSVGFVFAVSTCIFLLMLLYNQILGKPSFFPSEIQFSDLVLVYGLFPYYLWMSICNFLFSSIGKTKIHDKLIFFNRVLQIGFLIVLSLFKVSIHQFLLYYGVTAFLIFLSEAWVLLKGTPRPSWSECKQAGSLLFQSFRWPYIDNLALASYPFTIFLIGLFVSSFELGNYNFTIQILTTMLFPFQVLRVKLQEQITASPDSMYVAILKRTLKLTALTSIIIALACAIIPSILPLVGLAKFSKTNDLLRVSIFSLPFQAFIIVFQGIWVALHKPRLSSALNIIYGGITIAFALLLTPKIGTWSGIWGTIAASAIVLILDFCALDYVKRKGKLTK